MKGIELLVTIIITGIALTGCQQKVEYMTPEITGQVIDRTTDKPIANVKVFLTSKDYDITGKDGHFLIPAIEYRYRLSPPKPYEYRYSSNASLIFMSSQYIDKYYVSGSLPNPLCQDSCHP